MNGGLGQDGSSAASSSSSLLAAGDEPVVQKNMPGSVKQ